MRIDRLDLTFGRFEGYSLDLAAEGVHLVVGRNEAGKSTVRHAIGEFLFGIHPQTPYDFAFASKSELRIGALLRAADGATAEVVRYKRNKAPLVGADDEPFDLAPFLGGIARREFEEQFAIDHAELLRGGEALFAAKGDLARSLFETQSGARLNIVLKQLGEEMDRLYKQRASLPTLNAAIARHAEAKAKFKNATLRVEQYEQQKSRLDHAEKERARLEQELGGQRGECSRLERVRQAMPVLASLAQHVAERDTLAAAGPAVRRETGETFAALLKRIEEADAAEAQIGRRLERVVAARAELVVDHAVLDQEADIDWLYGERKAVEEAQTRAEELRRTAAGLHAAAAELADADDAAPGLVRRIEECRTALTKLETETEAARKDVRKRAKARDKAVRRLDELVGGASSDDADRSDDGAASVRMLRPLLRAADRTIPDTLTARQLDVTRFAEELDALRRRHGLAEDAHERPVPAAEQVAAHRAELGDVIAALADNARRSAELRDAIDRRQRDLDLLLQSGAPPTEAELTAAREQRDRLWQEVRTRLVEERGSAAPGDVDAVLVEEHQDATNHADALADRLWREAERTNQRLRLQIDIDADAERLSSLATERTGHEDGRAALDTAWLELWRPGGLPVPDPAAASDLLTALAQARELSGSLATARGDLDAALAKAATTEAGLRTALPHAPAGLDLAAFLAYADEELQERQKAVSVLATATEELRDAEQVLEDCGDRHAEWTDAWNGLLLEHGLEGNPETVLARLAERTEAARRRSAAEQAESEAAVLEARVVDFAVRLAAVGTGQAEATPDEPTPDEPTENPYRAAEHLHQNLESQRAIALKQRDLDTQIEEHELELADAAGRRATADRAVDALVAEFGLAGRPALRDAVDRSAGIADRDERIRLLEGSLAGLGVPLATLRAEVAEFENDPDRLAAEFEVAESGLKALQQAYEDAISVQAEQRKVLRDLDESAGAAEASEKAGEELAVVVEQSEEYLRLHLARQVLETCMEDYRASNQDPVLTRAEGYFRTLTAERFERLVTDTDAKGRFLLRARRATGEHVDVEAMSEGTRDQLYLALRLAALDRHADAGRPMPVLLDDVLMTFDDDRSASALRVADAIAGRFQVIVFTHHPHVADLARDALPAGRAHVHRLPGAGPSVTSPTVPAQSGALGENDPRDALPAD